MAERVPGAAMRRRQRLLRAFHRHVQWQVKLELATALHHSAQRPRPLVEEPKEGVEGETYCAPRRQMPPPSGTRSASLAEPRENVERVQRHTVDQMVDAPLLPTFDVTVHSCSLVFSLLSISALPSRLSRCPRSCSITSLSARPCALRSWLNSWWKCRRPYPVWSRSLTFQFLVVEFLAVFLVLSQYRVRRSGLLRSSLTFQFLVVEVPPWQGAFSGRDLHLCSDSGG